MAGKNTKSRDQNSKTGSKKTASGKKKSVSKKSVPKVGKKRSVASKKKTEKKRAEAEACELIGPVKPGRPVSFDVKKGDAILLGIASGETLTHLCSQPGFVCRQTVTNWLLRGVSNESRELLEFAVKYKLAGDIRALLQEDAYLQTIRDIQGMALADLMDGEWIRQEMVLDAMKWYLSKFRNRRTEVDGLEDAVRKLAQAVGSEDEGSGGNSGFRFVVHRGANEGGQSDDA